MTDSGFVIVDSNVVIDIVRQDPSWAAWSLDMLSRHPLAGVNPIIFAEICYQKTSAEEVDGILKALDLSYEELPREALYLASLAYRIYRRRGGSKTAPLPDFFIGAHAAALGVPILTRDLDRYRTYFPTVDLISP